MNSPQTKPDRVKSDNSRSYAPKAMFSIWRDKTADAIFMRAGLVTIGVGDDPPRPYCRGVQYRKAGKVFPLNLIRPDTHLRGGCDGN